MLGTIIEVWGKVDVIPAHSVSEKEPDAFFGKGNWKKMPDEKYKRLRHEPESWIVKCADKYFTPFVERMKQKLLKLPVTQSDETPP